MSGQSMFTLDLNRCTGCAACAIACRNENQVPEGLDWRKVRTFNEPRLEGIAVHHLSIACNHCAEPACMAGCPASAYRKDPGTGAVLLDADRCIGCGYCRWVCPYDAPQLNPATGVMEKCTFCSHRLADDLLPACVVACPVDALGYENAGPVGPHDVPGFPDTGLQPAIRVRPLRRGTSAPTDASAAPPRPPRPAAPRLEFGRLRSEWPLLVFSLGIALLVAWFGSVVWFGRTPHALWMPLLGAAAMNVSLLHLGKPTRAWRAISNLKTSWVSREIVSVAGFVGAASVVLAWPSLQRVFAAADLPDLSPGVGWAVFAVGLVALACIDRVYRVRGQRFPAIPHSAMTTLTACFLFGLLIDSPAVAATAGALKLAFHPWRVRPGEAVPLWLTGLRIGLGYLWPAAVWMLAGASTVWLVLGPLVAELLDRVRFYAELEFLSPEAQIERDLADAAATKVDRRREVAA